MFLSLVSEIIVDPTISLGSIISFVGILGSLWVMHAANVKRITSIEMKVELLFEWFKKRLEDNEDSRSNKRSDSGRS
jgi:predicted tellurium resistance membrane protein TerC